MGNKSELVVNGITQMVFPSTVSVFLNGSEVGKVERNKQLIVPIEHESVLTVKYAFRQSKSITVYPGRQTKVTSSYNRITGGISIEKISEEPPYTGEETSPMLRNEGASKNSPLHTQCAHCGKRMTPFSDPLQYNVMDENGRKTNLVICAACMTMSKTKKIVVQGNKVVMEDFEEIRMKCNVCGHIFCYSGLDVKQNIQHEKDAQKSALRSLGQALFTNQISSQLSANETQRHMDKIVDYSHCPKCHSADLVQITAEEAKNSTAQQNVPAAPAASAMDELKKLKELLDMGIVTQEEFDAKKKQLLGL